MSSPFYEFVSAVFYRQNFEWVKSEFQILIFVTDLAFLGPKNRSITV
jgi:hypothetical protein